MKMKAVCTSIIIFFVIMCSRVNSDLQPRGSLRDENVKFAEFPDHYVLAVQYSLSICSVEVCRQTRRENLPTEFSIHGLWPKKKDGTDAPNTTEEIFDENKLGSVKGELRKNWFDAYRFDKPQAYSSFWESEWYKHGMGSGLDLVDYYATTLKMHEKFLKEFKDIAQKNNYLPGTLIDLKQFANSFSPKLAVPWIRCAEFKKNGTKVVTEMQFRVEPTDFGGFKPHPKSNTDSRCGLGFAMLATSEHIK